MADPSTTSHSQGPVDTTVLSLLRHVEELEAENAALGEDLQQVHVLHTAAVSLEKHLADLTAENCHLRRQLQSITDVISGKGDPAELFQEALQNAEDFGYQKARVELLEARQQALQLERKVLELTRQLKGADS